MVTNTGIEGIQTPLPAAGLDRHDPSNRDKVGKEFQNLSNKNNGKGFDSSHTNSAIHYPRVFFYKALFLVPLSISLSVLFSSLIWKGTFAIDQFNPNVRMEARMGFLQLCVTTPSYYCRSIADVCSSLDRASALTDKSNWAQSDFRHNLCGSVDFNTAFTFLIIGCIAGLLAGLSVSCFSLFILI
jgi:hypothetical protein